MNSRNDGRRTEPRAPRTVPLYFNPAYIAAEYSFDTTRKAGWDRGVARALSHRRT